MKRIEPRPIIDLSRPDRQRTQVLDLSRTLQLRTVRLEVPESLLAELREAPAAPAAAQIITSPTAEAASLQSGNTLILQPAPVRTQVFARPHDLLDKRPSIELTNTLYDGGALRELAVQLASAHEGAALAARPPNVPLPVAELPPSMLRRKLAAFRRASLPQQLTIALLPLAIAGIWSMQNAAASATSAPGAPAVRAAPRLGASAASSAAQALPASPTPLAPSASEPAASETAAQPGDPSERLALIAAFSGNKAEAAARYDRLALNRNSRTFALAARLTREDRVRKP